MSAPKRPGAPRPSGRPGAGKKSTGQTKRPVTPGRVPATPSAGVPKPARRSRPQAANTRPGARTGSSRRAAEPKPRIEAAGARGSFAGALSWRTGVLAIVIVLALAVLLPSLRVYFAQQENLRELRAERDAAQRQVTALSDDLERWEDDAFVVAQARERLGYVFPGETPYRVVDPELVEAAKEEDQGAFHAPDTTVRNPWYSTLWESIEEAGGASGDDAEASGEAKGESAP